MLGRSALLQLAAGLLLAGSAHAVSVVQFDLSPAFNADVIVNNGSGGIDPVNDPIDLGLSAAGNFAFPTQSVAAALAPSTPDGLPGDGLFTGSPAGFPVQLAYRNDNNGLNAFRLAGTTGTFSFGVPLRKYNAVHVYAASGDGSADITVTLMYAGGATTSVSGVVPDWFDDPLDTATRYRLINGRDRMNPGAPPGVPFAYEESNDPAIFGLVVTADPDKLLFQVTIERTDTTGALSVLGASGLPVETCCGSCELIALLEPLGVLSPAPADSPCSLETPGPPSVGCCELFNALLPVLPGPPADLELASLRPVSGAPVVTAS